MKKSLSLLVCATALIGLSQLASAAATDTINGQSSGFNGGTADIDVNGTLGAVNTDPNAPIDPTDPTDPSKPNPEWINVTVPTATIFHNTKSNPAIESPTYTITNNSGRPVDVAVSKFTLIGAAPSIVNNDYNLTLDLETTSTKNVEDSTPLITKNVIATSFPNYLVTLANNDGQQTKTGASVADSDFATFTYGGTATITSKQTPQYTLNLKFTAVTTEFDNN